jgi:hypothetical protein
LLKLRFDLFKTRGRKDRRIGIDIQLASFAVQLGSPQQSIAPNKDDRRQQQLLEQTAAVAAHQELKSFRFFLAHFPSSPH